MLRVNDVLFFGFQHARVYVQLSPQKKEVSVSTRIYSLKGRTMANYMQGGSVSGFKHRSRVTIIKDILRSTHGSRRGSKKTQIMQSANLNYYQANKYLRLLMINGLLHVDNEDRYRVTDRGLEFVEILESLHLELR